MDLQIRLCSFLVHDSSKYAMKLAKKKKRSEVSMRTKVRSFYGIIKDQLDRNLVTVTFSATISVDQNMCLNNLQFRENVRRQKKIRSNSMQYSREGQRRACSCSSPCRWRPSWTASTPSRTWRGSCSGRRSTRPAVVPTPRPSRSAAPAPPSNHQTKITNTISRWSIIGSQRDRDDVIISSNDSNKVSSTSNRRFEGYMLSTR